MRIGLFYLDHVLLTRNIEKAMTLIEGGDWDRRNRLKFYQGAYCIAIRDFKAATNFFLDTVSTYTSYELINYATFVRYTVYVATISLPRNRSNGTTPDENALTMTQTIFTQFGVTSNSCQN